MAQGKMKVKAAAQMANLKKSNKNKVKSQKKNTPVISKKRSLTQTQNFKKKMSKSINEAVEKELREKAMEGKSSLKKGKST